MCRSWFAVVAVLATFAMLATAAVLLVRAARPRSGLLSVLPLPATTPTRPRVVCLHAPPDLHALSVLRC